MELDRAIAIRIRYRMPNRAPVRHFKTGAALDLNGRHYAVLTHEP